MSKRALLIAFHFPPIKVSSGLERTLALTRHLPSHGWEPLVLSASERAYPAVSSERMGQIPAGTVVERCFARDSSRLFSVSGRYPSWVTLPDRWQNWVLGAIPTGLAMIRRYKPDIIWSTYPIATAHVIGHALHRLSGIPWVADFRDPMVEFDDRTNSWAPTWPALRRSRLAIEGMAAKRAAALSFCTDGSAEIYRQRFPEAVQTHWSVIPNGFDESAFASASARTSTTSRADEILLLHSGTIYPTPDRDPSHFFRALRRVIDQRRVGARRLRVIMRASSVDQLYSGLLHELGLADHISFEPAIPYEEALAEMLQADGVLVFQGYTSNPAIPAKLYEYFRAGRPILAMADDQGDTAKLIRSLGAGQIAPLDDVGRIASELSAFVHAIESKSWSALSQHQVACFERAKSVERFANLFEKLSASRK